MKCLHVWDQAGVSGILAKYQRRLGNEVVVCCRDGYDGFKQKEFYGVLIVGPKRRRFKDFGVLQMPLRVLQRSLSEVVFYGWVVLKAREFDVVHIHSQYLVSLLLPLKAKVVEFHGDDVRDSPSKQFRFQRRMVKLYLRVFGGERFLVSTPDMLKDLPNAEWLPNPVDVDLFKPVMEDDPGRAVYFHNWYESGAHAKELAEKNGWELSVVDRVKQRHLFYRDMPAYLRGFEYMIDRKEIHSLSKTALEALACGLKVVDWKGEIHEGLPEQHNPFKVAELTLEIYKQQLGGKPN